MAIQTLTSAGAVDALRAPVIVIDDFLPDEVAQAMRADIEAHFANPGQHKPESHQVWNYWFVPGQYTYLRTNPDKVVDRKHIEAQAAQSPGVERCQRGLDVDDGSP